MSKASVCKRRTILERPEPEQGQVHLPVPRLLDDTVKVLKIELPFGLFDLVPADCAEDGVDSGCLKRCPLVAHKL